MTKVLGGRRALVLAILQASLLFTSLLAGVARADKGSIAPYPGVEVVESGQKALIAWNGTHEYLLLSVDAWLSIDIWYLEYTGEIPLKEVEKGITVLQVMPFPSAPLVLERDDGPLRSLVLLVRRHISAKAFFSTPVFGQPGPYMGMRALGPGEQPPIELISYEEIGAHHLAVILVRDAGELADWAAQFFSEKGFDVSAIRDKLAKLERVAADYVRRGYCYFTLDMVTITQEVRTIEPLAYVFECDHVFFPLYISSLATGMTSISIFVLAHGWLAREDASRAGLTLVLKDELTADELSWAAPEIYEMLGRRGAKLTVLKYEGDIRALRADLEAVPRFSFEDITAYLQLGSIASASILVAVVPMATALRKPRRLDPGLKVASLAVGMNACMLLALSPLIAALARPPYLFTSSATILTPWHIYTFMLAVAASIACLSLASTGSRTARDALSACLIALVVIGLFLAPDLAGLLYPHPLLGSSLAAAALVLAACLFAPSWLLALTAGVLLLSYRESRSLTSA